MFRVDGHRVHRVPVQTGLASVSAVAITAGLDEGALVVVSPADDLHDGMRVAAERRDQPLAGSGG
ncbi:MAG: hypothetical protein U0802_03190 [Candidatus Binatia bacterium]